MRTKACRKLVDVDPVCLSVATIAIGDYGIMRRYLNKRWIYSPRLNLDNRAVTLNHFAIADGFENWADMLSFFDKTYGLPFKGVLIRW